MRKGSSFTRYRGFMESVLKQSEDTITATNVDIRDYTKHILITGKREDKQAILGKEKRGQVHFL